MKTELIGRWYRRPALFLGLAIVGCMLAVVCGVAAAQDEPAEEAEAQSVEWGVEFDYNPRYVWRGIAWSEGAVLQTSLWATAKGVTYSIWTNNSLDSDDGGRLNEIDYALAWSGSWRNFTLEPTLQLYTYPNQEDAPSTAEAEVKLSWPLGPLTAFTTHTVDIAEYRGAYFGQLGISHQKQVGVNAELESSVSLGWGSAKFNEAYIGPSKFALNVGSIDIGLTWNTKTGIYIRPHLGIARILSGDLRDALDDSSLVNFGVAVGAEF